MTRFTSDARRFARRAAVGAALAAALAAPHAAPASAASEVGHAAPPPVFDDGSGTAARPAPLAAATQQYVHGDPTDDEQLFLELMNRARLDPQAEADRILDDYDNKQVQQAVDFFLDQRPGVEFTRRENHDYFDALAPSGPLAFHPQLIAAARKHSQVMLAADLQTHQATGEKALRQRVEDEGYDGLALGESVYAFAKSMVHAHAGFAIDWGQPLDGGSGRPLHGHRDALMNDTFREIGIGVIDDAETGNQVGPQLATLDFAQPSDDSVRLVTGVVFDDRDGDGFYDVGEGVAGVRIESDASAFFALSSASGGYAFPVPKNAGAITVTATGAEGTAGEFIGTQELRVTVGTRNVKADFSAPPEPQPPVFTAVAGSSGRSFQDGRTLDDFVDVGVLDPEVAGLGDVDVSVDITHADRTGLHVLLTNPAGTTVVLFDGETPGAHLRGTFDRTLRPTQPLAALVGEAYAGSWRLRVVDDAGGAPGGTLVGWTLRVRPAWIRPLHAPTSGLSVTSLKVKDAATAGGDKLVLKAVVDAGGTLLDPLAPGSVLVTDLDTDAQVLFVRFGEEPAAEGPVVTATFQANAKGTSRAALKVKASAFDLPGALPARVRVHVDVGGALVSQDVALSNGRSAGPPRSQFLFVDKVLSRPTAGGPATVVNGRFAAADGALAIAGRVDVQVGDARFRIDAGDMTTAATKRIYKSASGLRKLVLDPVAGTFSLKVDGAHSPLDGDVAYVALTIGDAYFGAAQVLPRTAGTKIVYP